MTDLQIVATYSAFLTATDVPHVLGGSIASSAWGEQRHTNDADFLVQIEAAHIDRYLAALPDGFTLERREVLEAVTERRTDASFQVLYEPSVFKIDNFVVMNSWDEVRIARARRLSIWGGIEVPFSTPEDMVIAKLKWFDLGRRISDRQWNDVVRLYEVQKDGLDVTYIAEWLGRYGLLELWSEVQRQARI